MSETFMDGGHDHGSHGHSHSGHADGAALGQTHSHGHHNNGFLSNLFGDGQNHGGHEHGAHGEHANHHHHHAGELSSNPQGSAMWTSAFAGLKFSDLFRGITVTPNMMFLFLFLGFTGWLGVVYWVRHNEPFASQVIGTRTAHAPTGHADRKLVEGIRQALPFRTSPTAGMIYVPGVPSAEAMPHANVPAAAMASPADPHPFAQQSAMPDTRVAPVTHNLPAMAARGAYHVPIHTADGVRLKTVVNR